MLTHHNLVTSFLQSDNLMKLTVRENSCTLAVLPFYHIYGMLIPMNRPLRIGTRAVTLSRFDLEQLLQLVQKHGVTHLPVVPPIVLALAKHPSVDQHNLSTLQFVSSGAAPLDARVQQQCAQRLGCVVTHGYGMTETTGPISNAPDDASKIKFGSSGLLMPNMEAKILDVASGTELGPNERGEIVVRGPNVMQGYLNNANATAEMLDAEGWLRTGDVGYIDDDGYFFIVDRVKELIKYKAYQVAPAELETILLSHPAVADAAVIGSPDGEAGEVPKAFVVARAPITAEEIMTYIAERVAPHKKIRKLEMVDQIPKLPSGKVLRRILVERERAARKQ